MIHLLIKTGVSLLTADTHYVPDTHQLEVKDHRQEVTQAHEDAKDKENAHINFHVELHLRETFPWILHFCQLVLQKANID